MQRLDGPRHDPLASVGGNDPANQSPADGVVEQQGFVAVQAEPLRHGTLLEVPRARLGDHAHRRRPTVAHADLDVPGVRWAPPVKKLAAAVEAPRLHAEVAEEALFRPGAGTPVAPAAGDALDGRPGMQAHPLPTPAAEQVIGALV